MADASPDVLNKDRLDSLTTMKASSLDIPVPTEYMPSGFDVETLRTDHNTDSESSPSSVDTVAVSFSADPSERLRQLKAYTDETHRELKFAQKGVQVSGSLLDALADNTERFVTTMWGKHDQMTHKIIGAGRKLKCLDQGLEESEEILEAKILGAPVSSRQETSSTSLESPLSPSLAIKVRDYQSGSHAASVSTKPSTSSTAFESSSSTGRHTTTSTPPTTSNSAPHLEVDDDPDIYDLAEFDPDDDDDDDTFSICDPELEDDHSSRIKITTASRVEKVSCWLPSVASATHGFSNSYIPPRLIGPGMSGDVASFKKRMREEEEDEDDDIDNEGSILAARGSPSSKRQRLDSGLV